MNNEKYYAEKHGITEKLIHEEKGFVLAFYCHGERIHGGMQNVCEAICKQTGRCNCRETSLIDKALLK